MLLARTQGMHEVRRAEIERGILAGEGARNIERDLKSARMLDTLAWTVITVWEFELSKKNREATINRMEADLRAAKEKYESYCAKRRESREYALEQARKHREILAQVEAELNLPKSLRRYAKLAEREL